jgi:hypothetical protein
MFEITAKGRAFIAHETRPRAGCAPWVRASLHPVRRQAQPLPPA